MWDCVCLFVVLVAYSCAYVCLSTFGVRMNPWCGTVDLQWTAIKHFRETGSHLQWKAPQLKTDSLWLGEALKCQPGFNELELELSWAETTTKQKALWTPNIYGMYSSSSDKSLMTVPMKPGQQGRVKTVGNNRCRWFTHQYFRSGRQAVDSRFLRRSRGSKEKPKKTSDTIDEENTNKASNNYFKCSFIIQLWLPQWAKQITIEALFLSSCSVKVN